MDQLTKTSQTSEILRNTHFLWGALIAACLVISGMSLFLSPTLILGMIGSIVAVVAIIKYPFLGLLLYMGVFLVRPAELYPALEPLRMERMVGVLVLIISLVRYKRIHGNLFWPEDLSTKMMLLFWGLIAISWITSHDQEATAELIEVFLKLIVLYVVIVYEVNTKRRFEIFAATFILLIAFIAFLSFRDYYGGGAIVRMGIQRAVGRTSAGDDPNSLAATLVTAIPLTYMYFRVYKSVILRIVAIGILGLLLIMIVNTGSRAGMLTVLTISGTLVWFTRHKFVTGGAIIALMAFSWFFLIPDQYRSRYGTLVDEHEDLDDVSSGRVAIWENGLRMIAQHPVFGVGGSGFRAANASGKYGPPLDMQPHSLYIQLVAEFGFIGFIVWMTFLLSMVHRLLAARPPTTEVDPEVNPEMYHNNQWFDLMRIGILATLVGLLLGGVFGHSLYRYTWYLMAALTGVLGRIYYGQLIVPAEAEQEAKLVAEIAEE